MDTFTDTGALDSRLGARAREFLGRGAFVLMAHTSRACEAEPSDALRQQTDPRKPAGRRFANFFFERSFSRFRFWGERRRDRRLTRMGTKPWFCAISRLTSSRLTRGTPASTRPNEIQNLAGLIARFGFRAPILIDGGKEIIAGEGRLLSATPDRFVNVARPPPHNVAPRRLRRAIGAKRWLPNSGALFPNLNAAVAEDGHHAAPAFDPLRKSCIFERESLGKPTHHPSLRF